MSERLARVKEALFRALNPGGVDADHPTSAPWLLLGAEELLLPFHGGISAHSDYFTLGFLEENSNFLQFIPALVYIDKAI